MLYEVITQGAGRTDRYKGKRPAKVFDFRFIDVGQRPDQGQASIKERLHRGHGADITGAGEIEQKGFNDIVAVVPQGEFVEAVVPRVGKELGTTGAGALETEISAARDGLLSYNFV